MKKTNPKSPSATQKKTAKRAAKKINTGYFLAPFIIMLISLAVETCLVFNSKTGFVGAWIYNIFTGIFGFAAYFIPAGALVIAFFFNSIVENRVMLYKSGMLFLFSAFFASLNSVVSIDTLASTPINVPDYFVKGYSGEGGGVIGGLVGKLMSAAFGNVLSVIISVIICILSLTLFLGTTKTGMWFYLGELRMFGAEKTAVLKAPKKAPEKISSKEQSESALPPERGTASFTGVESVPTVFGAPSQDPFRYGSEVSVRNTKKTGMIDLRSPETKRGEEVRDIYSDEAPVQKENPNADTDRPSAQLNPGSGRAYSPFAAPFIKREEFMKNGTVSEPRETETSHAPSRAYSPFADPLIKREDFINQGRPATPDARAVSGGYTPSPNLGNSNAGAVQDSYNRQTQSAAQPHANSTLTSFASQSGNPIQTPFGAGTENTVRSPFAAQSGNPAQPSFAPQFGSTAASETADAVPQPSYSGTFAQNASSARQVNTPSQDPTDVQSFDTTYADTLNEIASRSHYTGQAEASRQPKENSGNDVRITFENIVPEKTEEASVQSGAARNAEDDEKRAPWEVAVQTAALNTAPYGSSAISSDDYSEDVEYEDDETDEDETFVGQKGSQRYSSGDFANAYAERYNEEKQNFEQPHNEERLEYRDRTQKLYPNYVYPSSVLLEQRAMETTVTEDDVIEVRNKLLGKLASFRIEASLVGYSAGPSVTRYELAPGPGVSVKAITNRIDDISLELQSDGVRIATVPGKSVIGIEVPNRKVSVVSLRSLLENRDFMNAKSKITVCVGLTVTGKPVYMDIDDMPHVLIAGQTKSGKSVAINCMLLSLLYRTTPDEVQLILIDPKRVELNIYSKVPHLVMPVIDDPQRAAAALRWAVNEMERRYEIMDELGVRNRDEYYELKDQDPTLEYMPQIVIVIDELADLMLQVKEHVETLINRLAAKARACGIHLLVGTQRPSVDIVTGLIKANIPARISFQVSSGTDSKIILGAVGAEKLLGRGDMLYQATGAGRVRVQGAFVSSGEIKRVTSFIIENNGEAVFDPEVMRQLDVETDKINKTNKKAAPSGDSDSGCYVDSSEIDYEYICKAMEYIFEHKVVTTNNIQRHLHIGFNRAADIVDTLEEMRFISPRNGSKPRDILIEYEEFEQWKLRNAP